MQIQKSKETDQDGHHSEMITQLLLHVTSSAHNGDVKGDIFRRTIPLRLKDLYGPDFYWTKMYPMALMFLLPLSGLHDALFPHELKSSRNPPVPNPIFESQE